MEKTIQRIVDLRQSGLTWKQIDELMFPEKPIRLKGATYSGDLAVKHKNDLAAGAFTKKVIGCFTRTQIVVKLRDTVVPMRG